MSVAFRLYLSGAQRVLSEDRVRKGAEKLAKYLNAKQQGRLDGFFAVKPKEDKKNGPKGKQSGKDAKKGGGAKRKVRCKFTRA